MDRSHLTSIILLTSLSTPTPIKPDRRCVPTCRTVQNNSYAVLHTVCQTLAPTHTLTYTHSLTHTKIRTANAPNPKPVAMCFSALPHYCSCHLNSVSGIQSYIIIGASTSLDILHFIIFIINNSLLYCLQLSE